MAAIKARKAVIRVFLTWRVELEYGILQIMIFGRERMLEGYYTALITPFDSKLKVDESAYCALIETQIESGINGIVTCGTTGEAPTLSEGEFESVVSLAIETAKKRVPVIAGTASNCTQTTIENTKLAEKLGADGALIAAPYYNKPTQEGLYLHYKAVHDATNIPIILYNVPGRSVVDIGVDTIARLAKLPRIAGIKECSGDVNRVVRTRAAAGSQFCQMTGDDPMMLPFLIQGGAGCISVTSNVAPKLCVDLYKAWKNKDIATVSALNDRLLPLHDAMFCESNPGPAKYAASLMGFCREDLRLPLAPLSAANKEKVKVALDKAGLKPQNADGQQKNTGI